MKSPKAAQGSADISSLSIPDAEEIVEEALNDLAFTTDPGLARALHFLAPPGYQAIVELCGENGRSKRRNASADTWSPEEDEVRIYFERVDSAEAAPRASRAARASVGHDDEDDEDEDGQEAQIPADLDARVKELCAALAEAERGGHAFIALKQDRQPQDARLPNHHHPPQPRRGRHTRGGTALPSRRRPWRLHRRGH